MTIISQRPKYILLLLAVLFFHLWMNYEVLSKSKICRTYDEVNRLNEGIRDYQVLFSERNKCLQVKSEVLRIDDHGQGHPPFVQVIQALAIKLLSFLGNRQYDVESVILLTNGFFLFILLFSVYGIGSIVYSKNAGILAAFLVSFFPMVYGHSRIMMLDFPLASMVALSFCCLFKSRRFNSAIYSILSGIAIGLAVLTKESAVVFIAFPLIYYFYESHRFSPTRKTVLNFTLTLLFTVLTAGLVYLRPVNFPVFKIYINLAFFIDKNITGEPLIYLKSLLLYPGVYLFTAMIPALIGYFRNIRLQNKTILLWVFVPLAVFNFIPNKSLRFLIPLLPAFALIAAAGLFQSKIAAKIKRIYLYFLIIVAFMQYFIYLFSFPKPLFKKEYSGADFPPQLTYRNDAYYPENMELLNFFTKERKSLEAAGKGHEFYKVLFLFDIGEISSGLRLEGSAKGLPFGFYSPEEGAEFDRLLWLCNWSDLILNSAYIVDISGVTLERGQISEKVASMLRENFNKHKPNFKLAADMVLFNGSHLYIYKNINLER